MGNCGRKKAPQQNATILSEEEIRLLLQNTHLDRKQINDLHAEFLRQCPTGRMNKKDFLKFFKEFHPAQNKREKAEKFCDYAFKVIDRKNKGYISFEDFVLCLSLTSHGDLKEKCEFAFKLYDLDKDNKITKSEMTKVLTALYDLSGIENRKGDNAPAKKVDKIVNEINKQKNQPTTPGKKTKPLNYITKDQFIDAVSNDTYIKNLFMDPIFVFHDSSRHSAAPQSRPVQPVVDIPTVYIENIRHDQHPVISNPIVYNTPPSPPAHVVTNTVTYTPPQIVTKEENHLALFLDEKETFDLVDKYIAEANSRRYVTEAPSLHHTEYHETRSFQPVDTRLDSVIDISKPVVEYVLNDNHAQDIKHLI
jgi:neuronal calcium sensor 1